MTDTPHWVRGRESVELVSPFPGELVMLGLGNSVATPPEGIEAEVLVVTSFRELGARAAEANGRIVLFNAPVQASATKSWGCGGMGRVHVGV